MEKRNTNKEWISRNEFLEVNTRTGEVRNKETMQILKYLRYYSDSDEIREYRSLLDDDADNYLNEDTTDLEAIIDEEWYDLVGYDDYKEIYQISSEGRLMNKKTGRILKPHKVGPDWKEKGIGYIGYELCFKGERLCVRAHRLVALAMIYNDDPKQKTQVHHLDGDPTNNNRNNLIWVSPEEHARLHLSKAVEQYDLEDKLIAKYDSITRASEITGISHGAISQCISGKSKTSGGYKWKLADNL